MEDKEEEAQRLPCVALATTKRFRQEKRDQFAAFLVAHAAWLCAHTRLFLTGRTYDEAVKLLKEARENGNLDALDPEAFAKSATQLPPGSVGVVAVAFELIEGRMSAVFHLSHWKDINATFEMRAMKRQALVHNVLYADSAHMAEALVTGWKNGSTCLSPVSPGPEKRLVPLDNMKGKRTLALIAHDAKKLDACLLAVENLPILLSFDYIICTGTTGGWISKFLSAAACHQSSTAISGSDLSKKIIRCESGPLGGDVQIAHCALNGLCAHVIFLIDPMTSHPHEPDIHFFEQVLDANEAHHVQLATNLQSAEYLLSQFNKNK
ncbi:Methylglyoxal synthase [Balamuthia mandrillaris]